MVPDGNPVSVNVIVYASEKVAVSGVEFPFTVNSAVLAAYVLSVDPNVYEYVPFGRLIVKAEPAFMGPDDGCPDIFKYQMVPDGKPVSVNVT